MADSQSGCGRNVVWVVKRQQSVQFCVAGGRQTRRVGDRSEVNTSLLEGSENAPVQRESGGGRLERDRRTGDRRPHIPEGHRRLDVRVLDRAPVACETLPDLLHGAVERELNEARMSQDGVDGSAQRSEPEPVAYFHWRR